MNLSTLKPAKNSTKSSKRIGRGQGSGKGGTSTRGHKGAKSRSGYSKKIGFEGGQMPLQRRVPKFGFTNLNRVAYRAINLDTITKLLEESKLTEVTPAVLVERGLADSKDLIKVLGRGDFGKSVNISAHKFSQKAIEVIEAAGGKAVILGK